MQAYEFTFDPRKGREMVYSSLKPVATGVSIVADSAGATESSQGYPFQAEIRECWEEGHEEFGGWPRMVPSTTYFVVFAVASSTGSLNPVIEGTMASTV